MYQIFKSSERLIKPEPKRPKHDFPWNTVECGESFAVPRDQIKLETLRPLCSAKGKELNKKFRMIVHENCYEVGRIK